MQRGRKNGQRGLSATFIAMMLLAAAAMGAALLLIGIRKNSNEDEVSLPPSETAPLRKNPLGNVTVEKTVAEPHYREPRGFSDFVGFVYPNRSTLLAEVSPFIRTAPPIQLTAQPDDDEVVGDFPCVELRRRRPAPAPLVRLYVPWPNIQFMSQNPLVCPLHCELTNKPDEIATSHGYVVDTLGAMVNEKYDWVSNPLRLFLIAFNTENIRGRLKVLRKAYGIRYLAKPYTEDFWKFFNIVISYEAGSMIRVPFYHWANCREDIVLRQTQRMQLTNVSFKWAKELGPSVLFFSRNCDHASLRRQAFVRKLMAELPVTAVGRCLNNREQDSIAQCRGVKERNKRLCIIASFTFYLAIENSASIDYVSEKVYEPLLVSTIPVYLGAPNIRNYLPTTHSAIIATDFSSIKQLAAYLKCVARTPHLLHHYRNWRARPRFPRFREHLERQFAPLCQACMLIAQNSSALFNTSLRHPAVIDYFANDEVNDQRPFAECLS